MSELQDLVQNYRVLISAKLCAISVNFFTLSDFVQTSPISYLLRLKCFKEPDFDIPSSVQF